MTKLRAFSERAAAVLVFTFVLMASTGAVAAGWSKADLTAITGAPAAAGVPMGYTTNLNGQGPVARVVYETTSGHVEELSATVASGWSKADLTAITGAPAAAGVPMGYTTNLNGQGPVARVVYETTSGHVEELSVA
jgi:hypothetical protein